MTDEKRTRGLLPDDDRAFCWAEIEKLRTAQSELGFLLDRGYPIKSAVTFIGNHHQLTARQALALMRSTASSESLIHREEKRLGSEALEGKTVYIDGFNLIITLEVALSDGMLFIGQDGCVRDLAELRGTYRLIPQTEKAIGLIRNELAALKAARAVFLLDQPVSNSGRLKTKIFEIGWPTPVEVQIVRSPDTLLKKLSYVVTGDSVIIDQCQNWFNMAAHMLEKYEEFKNLSRLIHLDGRSV